MTDDDYKREVDASFREGLEQGRREGVLAGTVQAAQWFLGRPVTPEGELFQLPLTELSALPAALTAKALAKER